MVIQEMLQRRQEPWRWEAQWPAIESKQQQNERFIEADPLTTTREFAKELNINHPELTKKKKNCPFAMSSLILFNNNEPFLDWIVTRDRKWILDNNQLSGWTEKLQSTSQSQTWTKKGHSHCLVVCCLSDPPQLSESRRNHCTWEVWSENWWNAPKTAMPAASICSIERTQGFSATMPDCILHKQCFKSWMNCATEFWLIHHIHLPSISWLPLFQVILTTFCRENPSTTNRWQKMFSKSLSNPKAQIFFTPQE